MGMTLAKMGSVLRRPVGAAGAAAVAGALLGLVYALTVQPGVPGGDAPEIITAALTGGVAHPPGYPLYSLLLRAVFLLPLPVALGANLLSALLAALSGAAVAAVVVHQTGRMWVGVGTAVCAGLAPRVWTYATGAEVFALNLALCATALLLASRAWLAPRRAEMAGVGLLIGLALSNHHTSALVLVPVVTALLVHTGNRRWTAITVAGLAVGLLPYALLPLWAHNASAMSWGDASSLRGLWDHVLRREYGTFQLQQDAARPAGPWGSMAWQAADAWRQTLGGGAVAMGVATGWALWRKDGWTKAVAAGLLLHLGVFHALNNMPQDLPLLKAVQARFFLLPLMWGWVLVGVWMGSLQGKRVRRVGTAALGALALALAMTGWPAAQAARSHVVELYGSELLRVMPPRALAFTRGDLITGTMRYLQSAMHMRDDVAVVDQEMLSRPWGVAVHRRVLKDVVFPGQRFHPRMAGGFSLKELVAANLHQRPVVVCGGFKAADGSAQAFPSWPRGMCTQLFDEGTPLDAQQWLADSAAWVVANDPVLHRAWPVGSWAAVAQQDLLSVNPQRALHLMVSPWVPWPDAQKHALAADLLAGHLKVHPNSPPEAYKNLGYACSRLLAEKGRAQCVVGAWQTYLQRGPTTDPDRTAIIHAVQQLSESTAASP